MFDVVFIQFDEPQADIMFENLLNIHPLAKRITGVTGIREAHVKAATIASTDMFYVIDGDCEVLPDFNFEFKPIRWDYKYSHVWYAENHVNHSCYGYGGIKLLNKQQIINAATKHYIDFFSAASPEGIKVIEQPGSITRFDQSPLLTFRAVVREVVKLTLNNTAENIERLCQWRTNSPNTIYAEYYLKGLSFADLILQQQSPTKYINDFSWLKQQYLKYANDEAPDIR